jgi:hypothetical protein
METFLNAEVLENNLATLENSMTEGRTSLTDYLKIAMLCKIYETLEEIKDKINNGPST